MKLLVLDNYDSFTYNLVHYVELLLDADVDVFRNDQITVEEAGKYDAFILSPGPGLPEESGILKELIKTYAPTKRIFGVCLGMQAIGEVFGAQLLNLKRVYHGEGTPIDIIKEENLFKGLANPFMAGRYHSWVVGEEGLPDVLEITAKDEEGGIMALRHKEYDVRGVQFHPESVLTPQGLQLLANWLGIPYEAEKLKAICEEMLGQAGS